LTATATCSQ